MLSREHLLTLINGLGGIVWEADPDTFQFSFVSAEAERILGFPVSAWTGDPDFWRHHTHPDDIERCTKFCMEATRGGQDHEFEYRMIAADGRVVWLRDIVSVRTSPEGARRLVGIALDISSEKAQQRALEATQEQLAEAMKMEAVGRLAGGVAHDFNNLLTIISGYAELVAASLEAPDPRADDLGEIKRAAHRASLLTRQLLTFSRKQVVRPIVLDLNTVVLEVSVLIRRLIGEDVQLVLEISPEPARVLADAAQLEQVLMNLAVNARDAMPLGGQLSIRTETGGGLVRLAVSDTGSGMPAEIAARCFEPFFTTRETGKGTGLGLSTAYGIIKQAGGDIQVGSSPAGGCVFTITLPLSRTSEAQAIAASARGGGETILVVEDEDQVRALVEEVLTRLGYTVMASPDGVAALEICRTHGQGLSLLITDVVMPKMSGPQVFAKVEAMVPGVPVLYISGYIGDAVFARGPRDEAAPLLQKPFTPAALAEKVRKVLDDAGPERPTR